MEFKFIQRTFSVSTTSKFVIAVIVLAIVVNKFIQIFKAFATRIPGPTLGKFSRWHLRYQEFTSE